jgi:protein-tyrosine phosphatase
MTEHGHFHDIGGPFLRSGVIYRTGWTMLAGCPRPPSDDRFACRIDMRSTVESASSADTFVRIPVDLPGAAQRLAGTPSDAVYQQLYVDILRQCGSSIAAVITRLAQVVPAPVVLGCSLGKDRTGLVVAVLMRALDVPADVASRQETVARQAIVACAPAARSYAAGRGVDIEEFTRRCTKDSSALPAAIDMIATEYGGIREYLATNGVPASVIATLRAALRGDGLG